MIGFFTILLGCPIQSMPVSNGLTNVTAIYRLVHLKQACSIQPPSFGQTVFSLSTSPESDHPTYGIIRHPLHRFIPHFHSTIMCGEFYPHSPVKIFIKESILSEETISHEQYNGSDNLFTMALDMWVSPVFKMWHRPGWGARRRETRDEENKNMNERAVLQSLVEEFIIILSLSICPMSCPSLQSVSQHLSARTIRTKSAKAMAKISARAALLAAKSSLTATKAQAKAASRIKASLKAKSRATATAATKHNRYVCSCYQIMFLLCISIPYSILTLNLMDDWMNETSTPPLDPPSTPPVQPHNSDQG